MIQYFLNHFLGGILIDPPYFFSYCPLEHFFFGCRECFGFLEWLLDYLESSVVQLQSVSLFSVRSRLGGHLLMEMIRDYLSCEVCTLILVCDGFDMPCGHYYCKNCLVRCWDGKQVCCEICGLTTAFHGYYVRDTRRAFLLDNVVYADYVLKGFVTCGECGGLSRHMYKGRCASCRDSDLYETFLSEVFDLVKGAKSVYPYYVVWKEEFIKPCLFKNSK